MAAVEHMQCKQHVWVLWSYTLHSVWYTPLVIQQCIIYIPSLGGERNRNKEFRFRFRHCRYRNSGRKKNGKFVILGIDFREDIFPVHFYSESESNSLKSIQRITNSLAFFLPDIRYRHCQNQNTNSWFLFRSPPKQGGGEKVKKSPSK